MPAVTANGITIEYEEHGKKSDPALLLIMGLGNQLTAWPDNFCSGLAAQGLRVIRFDNRDAGLSTKMTGRKTPNLLALTVEAPTLVISGSVDPLVPYQGGEDIAAKVNGARFELIEGLGHDLPDSLIPRFVEIISTHVLNTK